MEQQNNYSNKKSKNRKYLRKERRIIENILSFVDEFVDFIPKDKKELIETIKKSVNHNMYFVHDNQFWDKCHVINKINNLTEDGWFLFLKQLNCQIMQNKREQKIALRIETELKNKFPDEDIEVRELVEYGNNEFGIKIYMCGSAYLLEYTGTVEKFIDDLSSEINYILENDEDEDEDDDDDPEWDDDEEFDKENNSNNNLFGNN